MTLTQYYILAGAAGIAGTIFLLYALVQCGKVAVTAFRELAAIEDYEG